MTGRDRLLRGIERIGARQPLIPDWSLGESIGNAKAGTLVVAAHLDDESIAIATLLKEKCQSGTSVGVLIASHGVPRAWLKSRREVAALANRRTSEAREALARIGVHHVSFLGLQDGGIHRHWRLLVKAVHDLVHLWHPDEVYTHSFEGDHPDHNMVALIVSRYVSGVPVWEWAEYSVELPLLGERVAFSTFNAGQPERRLVLNRADVEFKQRVLAAYSSQPIPDAVNRRDEVVRPSAPLAFDLTMVETRYGPRTLDRMLRGLDA